MKQQLQTGTLMTLIVLGLLLAGFIIYKLAILILLMLIAGVISCGISPFVQRMERARIPRHLGTLLILLVGLLLFSAVITFLAYTAIDESGNFAQKDWPTLQNQVTTALHDWHARYSVIPDAATLGQKLTGNNGQVVTYLWTTTRAVAGFIGSLFSMLLVFVLTLFFTSFRTDIRRSVLLLVPPAAQARVGLLLSRVAAKLGGWLRGELVLVSVMVSVITLGMTLLRVPYPYFVGIVGGVGEMIPVFGPGIAFIPAIAIGLATGMSVPHLIGIAIFFVIVTQTDNYYLMPRVMQRHLELSPLTSVLALLAGGSLLGVVGAVLAVPLAAAGRVVLLEAVVPAIQGTPPPDANTPPIEESPARGKKKKRQDEPAPPSPQDEALQHIARLGQPDQPIADPPERV